MTRTTDWPAAASHSLCANCKYRISVPSRFFRFEVRKYTHLGHYPDTPFLSSIHTPIVYLD